MFRNLVKTIQPITQLNSAFLAPVVACQQQLRTTFILKRRHAAPLSKKGEPPKRLRNKHYIYDLVKDTSCEPKPDLKVILTQYVEGYGNAGDEIAVRPIFAYNHLLLPGLAVYPTPENLEKYKSCKEVLVKHSSPLVTKTIKHLSRMVLSVVMNKDNPWTLQKWHIRTSFRKSGYVIPEDAITLPLKPIKGPDMDLENREFYVVVTINNKETVNVRCCIHHWSTEVVERLPYKFEFWTNSPGPVFSEDAPVLETMPKKTTQMKQNAIN